MWLNKIKLNIAIQIRERYPEYWRTFCKITLCLTDRSYSRCPQPSSVKIKNITHRNEIVSDIKISMLTSESMTNESIRQKSRHILDSLILKGKQCLHEKGACCFCVDSMLFDLKQNRESAERYSRWKVGKRHNKLEKTGLIKLEHKQIPKRDGTMQVSGRVQFPACMHGHRCKCSIETCLLIPLDILTIYSPSITLNLRNIFPIYIQQNFS